MPKEGKRASCHCYGGTGVNQGTVGWGEEKGAQAWVGFWMSLPCRWARPEVLIDEKMDWILSGCSNSDVSIPITYHHCGFGWLNWAVLGGYSILWVNSPGKQSKCRHWIANDSGPWMGLKWTFFVIHFKKIQWQIKKEILRVISINGAFLRKFTKT